jgi:acyl-CoA reductase-like NAD-dependent aldehyde dehydrogenase
LELSVPASNPQDCPSLDDWLHNYSQALVCILRFFDCSILTVFSPFTPYTALKIGEIAAQIFPPGVIQHLGGDDNLGPWITKHPDIAKISFTGSTATGKKIMAAAAATLKRVNLEL